MNAPVIAGKLKVLWTGKVSVALMRLRTVMKANPYGVLTAAATALYTLIYKSMNRELSAAEQKQQALNDVNLTAQKNIIEQTAGLERLLKIARDETSVERRPSGGYCRSRYKCR
jgi:hypothetical protein